MWELFFFFHHVGSRYETQVICLGSKHLYQLSHPANTISLDFYGGKRCQLAVFGATVGLHAVSESYSVHPVPRISWGLVHSVRRHLRPPHCRLWPLLLLLWCAKSVITISRLQTFSRCLFSNSLFFEVTALCYAHKFHNCPFSKVWLGTSMYVFNQPSFTGPDLQNINSGPRT